MKNVLILCSHDGVLAGHAKFIYNMIPNKENKRIVTYISKYNKEPYAFHYSQSKFFILYRKLKKSYFIVKRWFEYGEPVAIDKNHSEYCFLHHDDCCVSAKAILKKCKGFIPDLIAIYWVADFISPKTIRDLHKITKAKILMCFVDEAPLAGGCHYHCDCDGYLNGCKFCPALASGKKFAEKQMENRKQYLKGLPIILCGTPYDIEKALKTDTYAGCDYFKSIRLPKVTYFNREESRKKYGVDNSDFVIFIGASSLKDPRKGFQYSIDAINDFAKFHKHITLLCLGRHVDNTFWDKSIKVITPGYLSFDEMCEAMCASDVFISSSVADSGPMTVNFAFALGLPTISFDIGIAHSLIVHKVTGYFAKYKDASSIMEGLVYISSMTDDERKAMGNRCMKRINDLQTPNWWDVLLK